MNTEQDTGDANLGDLVPLDANNKVSLRAAVQQANWNALFTPGEAFEIYFGELLPPVVGDPGNPPPPPPPPPDYTIQLIGPINPFAANISVIGHTRTQVTIIGAGTAGMFKVNAESVSAFRRLTLRDGNNQQMAGGGSGAGGAIENLGRLTVDDVGITACLATQGGAIFSNNQLTVSNSDIVGNWTTAGATGYGGGLSLAGFGATTITGTKIQGNTAGARGGGIAIRDTQQVTVQTSSILDNRATQGGGIYNSVGTLTMTGGFLKENSAEQGGGLFQSGGTSSLTEVTLQGNRASTWGGAVYIAGGFQSTLTLTTCTFADNQATGGGAKIARQGQPTINVSPDCVGINPAVDIEQAP